MIFNLMDRKHYADLYCFLFFFFFFFFFFVQELKDEVCLVMEVSEYICPILNMLVLCGMLFIILTPRLCVGQNGKCYLVW